MPIKTTLVTALAGLTFGACADAGREPSQPEPPEEVVGVITEIDSEGLDDVRSFTLKSGDRSFDVRIADDVDYGFPLGHLHEHRGGPPVRVRLEQRDEELYALSIEDA